MMVRRRKIKIPALPSQERFYASTAFTKGFSGPVGSGKTFALCYQALLCSARNPGCVGLIGAPTFPMLAAVTLPTMLAILEEQEIPYSYLKKENVLTLHRSQSRILFRSLERFENLRGPNLAWVGIDELTYCQPEAWKRLEARVRDPKASHHQMFAVWTPKGYDWVYKRFISPKEKLHGHEVILAAPGENVVVLAKSPDYYERLESSYDELFFRQEALGEYLNVYSGRVYHAYSEANESPDLEYNPQSGLCWALDFNVDPMTAIIAQYANGTIQVLEELFLRNADTISMCEHLERSAATYVQAYQAAHGGAPLPVILYGDATGQARSTSSKTDYDLIREFFRSKPKFRLQIDHPRTNPPVKDRVNSVNAMLKNASGRLRIHVHPACKELITDFYEVSWKQTDRYELDKATDKKRTHLSDALGYLVWRVEPINGFQRQNSYN